jgi:hypothetical protein
VSQRPPLPPSDSSWCGLHVIKHEAVTIFIRVLTIFSQGFPQYICMYAYKNYFIICYRCICTHCTRVSSIRGSPWSLMPPIIIFIVVLGETPWKCAANGAFVHPRIDLWVNVEQRWNDTDRVKNGLGEKPVPMPLFSTTNPIRLMWSWTWSPL